MRTIFFLISKKLKLYQYQFYKLKNLLKLLFNIENKFINKKSFYFIFVNSI